MPTLRILSWNLWHGLNPYESLLMSPMEAPLDHAKRNSRQLEVIRAWSHSPWEILCFQEVNPLARRFGELRAATALRGSSCLVNTGIKLAGFGVPPGLLDGLGILVGQGFSQLSFEELTLSGWALELGRTRNAPIFTLQISERRKALLFEGDTEGLKIAVINLHLHHGPDTLPTNLARKRSELERLREWIAPRIAEWDLVAICGDFNCDVDSAALASLSEMGFQDVARIAGQPSLPTWVPPENHFSRASAELAASKSEAVRQWDATSHVFDRIYLKTKVPVREAKLAQIREPELSDHFGVFAEVTL